MASVSSLMNSSSATSSIYGNRNVLSGLASGMDTETMIENCVKGYQAKISSLQQQQTRITWQQDAYRDITDKLIALSQKYTSYTSKTNLSSPGFFLNAVNTVTNGTNAGKVSATGRTNSDIKINAVKQLASAARYSVDANVMKNKASAVGAAVDFSKNVELTNISGDITLTVGRDKVTLSFAEDEVIKNADELAAAINKKLGEQEIGKVKADTRVQAVNNGGTIRFETIGDSKSAGDAVWISSAYGDIKETLGITAGALGKGDTSLSVAGDTKLYQELDRKEYLSGKTFEIKLGDKTAKVTLGDLTGADVTDPAETIRKAMQDAADAEFGKDKLKVEVKDGSFVFTPKTVEITLGGKTASVTLGDLTGADAPAETVIKAMQDAVDSEFGKDKLKVEVKDGSFVFTPKTGADGEKPNVTVPDVTVSSSVGMALGFGSSSLSNTSSTSSTLNQIFGGNLDAFRSDVTVSASSVRPAKNATTGVDKDNKAVEKRDGKWYRIEDGVELSEEDVRADENAVDGLARNGKPVKKEDGVWYLVDENGNHVKSEPDFDLAINGVRIDGIDKDSTIEDILSKINSSKAGVKASYSKLTNKFVITANETGSEGRVDVGGTLGEKLFGKTGVGEAEVYTKGNGLVTDSEGKALVAGYDDKGKAYYIHTRSDKNGEPKYYMAYENGNPMIKDGKMVELDPNKTESVANALKQARKGFEAGKDAIINATVNGDNVMLTRSSNVIDMDGMSVTLSDTFNNEKDANGVNFFNDDGTWNKNAKVETDSVVTFTTKADSDKILEAVQAFIEEYNALATQVRTEYSTTPLKDSNKNKYQPLTDEDREGMTESQIKAYEEKAKTGLLFGDTDLSGLHNSLRSAITPSGEVRGAMTAIGLTTKYENGITTLSLDEDKFRAALEKNADAVQKVFTASKENGDSYDGLMARMKGTVNTYASTSIGSYGVLVNKAGTKSKSLTLMNNTLQQKYNNLEEQIERWQTKMSDKVDYYTRQFTQLEKLMNEMNSQSSALAGLTGGY